jgi:endonuclease/exonuclease/phosphatase (EEP) superfamily protein YafD
VSFMPFANASSPALGASASMPRSRSTQPSPFSVMTSLLQQAARRGAVLAWLCALGALTVFVPYLSAPELLTWVSGLASHWQWVYGALGLAGSAMALAGHRYITVVPALVIATAWLYQSTTAMAISQSNDIPTNDLVVATANLNFEQKDHTALKVWLTSKSAPDVIALKEFTSSAEVAVKHSDVVAAYPHRVLEAREDQFGLAVLSKRAIESVERVTPDNPLATLKLRTVISVRGRHVAFTAVHPMPPISAAYARERDASLKREAELLSASGMPGILAGDMNDTPWSTGLRAAMPLVRATGITPTWPNAWGWLSTLPLDHVLVTPSIGAERAALGPDLGSDHRPVTVRLSF